MFDAKTEKDKIVEFIRDYFKNNNLGGVVIGISGGKDSGVVAGLFTESTIGISFPAGYVEKGEEYSEAALRELQEETGYYSNKLFEVASYYQDDGIGGALNKGFVALNCIKVSDQNLDESEYIRYFECSIDELIELYEKGYILDGGSQLVLEKAKELIKERR